MKTLLVSISLFILALSASADYVTDWANGGTYKNAITGVVWTVEAGSVVASTNGYAPAGYAAPSGAGQTRWFGYPGGMQKMASSTYAGVWSWGSFVTAVSFANMQQVVYVQPPTSTSDVDAFVAVGETGALPPGTSALVRIKFSDGSTIELPVPADGNMNIPIPGDKEGLDWTSEILYFDTSLETGSNVPYAIESSGSGTLPSWDKEVNTSQGIALASPSSVSKIVPNSPTVGSGGVASGSQGLASMTVPTVASGVAPSLVAPSLQVMTPSNPSSTFAPSQDWSAGAATGLSASDVRSAVGEGIKDALTQGGAPSISGAEIPAIESAAAVMQAANSVKNSREGVYSALRALSSKWISIYDSFLIGTELQAPTRVSVIMVPMPMGRPPIAINLNWPIFPVIRTVFALQFIIAGAWSAMSILGDLFS